jgi:hypothetical protein
MKSKTITAIMALLLTIATTNSYAVIVPDDPKPKTELPVGMTDEQKAARLAQIKARVAEIKSIDRSTLSKAERKALRKELREMNKEARAAKGVYLSVGAIIIIILLLILIL